MRIREPQENSWLDLAMHPSVVRRGLRYGLIVGAILVAINHGPELLGGEFSLGRLMRIALTIAVPYSVATMASIEAIRGNGPR